MSRRIDRELTALADGTLPPKRRDALLRQVFASPKLTRTLKEQLVAIKAIRRLDTPAPTELHERIQRATREACAAHKAPLDRDDRTRPGPSDPGQNTGCASMLNPVSFWRAMKLLSRMQQEENGDPRGGKGPAGLSLPDPDDGAARRHDADEREL